MERGECVPELGFPSEGWRAPLLTIRLVTEQSWQIYHPLGQKISRSTRMAYVVCHAKQGNADAAVCHRLREEVLTDKTDRDRWTSPLGGAIGGNERLLLIDRPLEERNAREKNKVQRK